jgi:DNA polymerase-3 subunit alpha
VRSGALDRMGPYFSDQLDEYQAGIDRNRAVLLAAMEEAIQTADQAARNRESGHMDLFGEMFAEEEVDLYAQYRNARELTLKERLKGEKETLGLYLTGHPIDEYEGEVRRFARQRIIDLRPARDTQTVAGLIVNLRVMRNKKGDKMGFITLDDRSARIEASLFAEAFNQAQALLQTDALVIVEGEVSHDDFSGGLRLRAKRVMGLEEARTSLAQSLRMNVSVTDLSRDSLTRLKALLLQYKGACPLTVQYTGASATALLEFSEQWKIEPTDDLIQALRDLFGKDNVFLHYR